MAQILAVNAGLLAAIMLALWAISVRIRDVSFVDAFWPFGMVLLALSTWLQADGPICRTTLILLLTTLWGLRLTNHLFLRWREQGEDARYTKIIARTAEKRGWSFATISLVQVFLLQGILLYIVCLPAQLGQIDTLPRSLGWLAVIGSVVAFIGILFETIGDQQLLLFRADPANKGKVLDTGLWRYTRHPNYFGDACTWWGIWLIAAETTLGLWSVIGPITITFLLTRLSGVPMLERGLKKSRPGYEDYVRRTSSFFPWPPKA